MFPHYAIRQRKKAATNSREELLSYWDLRQDVNPWPSSFGKPWADSQASQS